MADDKAEPASLRQALAIAIVRNKRRCDQEAAEWRAKSQKLEAALQEQQAKEAQLRAWVRTVMQQQSSDSSLQQAPASIQQADHPPPEHTTVFLPPLPATATHQHIQPAGTNFQALMQQLVVAAAAAGETYSSVADVLDGKAAALSSMLLTNLHVMQQVSGAGSNSSSLAHGQASDLVSAISSFVTSTLLHAPRSSLSTAYMKQSAACLAAALAPPATPAAATTAPAAAQHTQQDQSEADSSLAVQVVQLMQQLLQLRAPAQPTCAAATAMLQQLSLFPSTSLLLCLAAAQQLQQRMQELQEANAAVMHVTLENLAASAQAGQQALVTASHCFQASHDLLADLEDTVVQILVWGVALADSRWTPRALEELVTSATAMFKSCHQLQPQQPLLAGRICTWCASLATALQHLAANADAPGMKVGLGAELRSVTGGLCVRLRDLFMPAGC